MEWVRVKWESDGVGREEAHRGREGGSEGKKEERRLLFASLLLLLISSSSSLPLLFFLPFFPLFFHSLLLSFIHSLLSSYPSPSLSFFHSLLLYHLSSSLFLLSLPNPSSCFSSFLTPFPPFILHSPLQSSLFPLSPSPCVLPCQWVDVIRVSTCFLIARLGGLVTEQGWTFFTSVVLFWTTSPSGNLFPFHSVSFLGLFSFILLFLFSVLLFTSSPPLLCTSSRIWSSVFYILQASIFFRSHSLLSSFLPP